jgi:hypothetical protein
MNLGISILDDRLLLALHYGGTQEPEYQTFLFGDVLSESPEPGALWFLAGDEARAIYNKAEKVILALPASLSFLKRLELKGEYFKESPEYSKWLATIQLPGDISEFHYEFLPLRESFDKTTMEVLFIGAPLSGLNRLLTAITPPDDTRQIMVLPEQLGLIKTLEKSLTKDDIPQAGIVNCDRAGATAVYLKDGRFYHSRYFNNQPDHKDDLATDIETYFLSRAEASESLPLVISGFPNDFKTNWSPIIPAFLGIHNLEFAGAWGVAEYVYSGAK